MTMHAALLQQWTTAQFASGVLTFTQGAEDWLDVSSFADAAFWIDVSQVSGASGAVVQLVLQSSPTKDEAYFGPLTCPRKSGPTGRSEGASPKEARDEDQQVHRRAARAHPARGRQDASA